MHVVTGFNNYAFLIYSVGGAKIVGANQFIVGLADVSLQVNLAGMFTLFPIAPSCVGFSHLSRPLLVSKKIVEKNLLGAVEIGKSLRVGCIELKMII